MKRLALFLMIVAFSTGAVFAQDGAEDELEDTSPVPAQNEPEDISEDTPPKKHQFLDSYFGVSIGAGGMKTGNYGIFTADIGVPYGFYLHEWVSINTGLFFHAELYDEPRVNPLCFSIPFGVHFNIPKAEWLYTGISVAVNIPIADLSSPGKRDAFTVNDVFISLPVDFGFDFIKPGRGGPRAFFRITPTFHKGGMAVPIGFVWQIYNWKNFGKEVKINIDINVPPPTIIIIH
jgi:hypothetical protein